LRELEEKIKELEKESKIKAVDVFERLGGIKEKLDRLSEEHKDIKKDTEWIISGIDSLLTGKPIEEQIKVLDKLQTEIEEKKEKIVALSSEEKIIKVLQKGGQVNYTELKHETRLSDPTLSKHLKKLVKDGKVSVKKAGKFKFYQLEE
jgi:uncharacterized membrane protein